MTTPQLTSGRVDISATAQAPIHHGGGTSGNRQILRKQRVALPDGSHARVPFISGNSLKHMIRASAARYALEAMGVEQGSLTKGQIHLLFSGGALSGGGAVVKLAKVRELERLFPLLALCGYSAGNHMAGSKIQCSHWHVVCAENAWRLPDALRDHPHAQLRVGELIEDEFGTRHEPTRADPTARRLLCADDSRAQDLDLEALARAKASSKKGDKVKDSAQMIYDFEAIKAGSVWYGDLYYEDLTPLELAALKSGLAHACRGERQGRYLFARGAKSSVGYGAMAVAFEGSVRQIAPAVYEEGGALTRLGEETRDDLGDYASHLADHRDDILEALKEASR